MALTVTVLVHLVYLVTIAGSSTATITTASNSSGGADRNGR